MITGRRRILLGIAILAVVGGPVGLAIRRLATTRGAVHTYARLIACANAQDLVAIRSLCTDRYLSNHEIKAARQGGVVGLPRQIHPNYQVWVEGDQVWLCQGNRVGLVVRFVWVAGRWLYDGEVGLLKGDGRIVVPDPEDLGASSQKL